MPNKERSGLPAFNQEMLPTLKLVAGKLTKIQDIYEKETFLSGRGKKVSLIAKEIIFQHLPFIGSIELPTGFNLRKPYSYDDPAFTVGSLQQLVEAEISRLEE